MTKRVLAILMMMAMLLSFAACHSTGDQNETKDTSVEQTDPSEEKPTETDPVNTEQTTPVTEPVGNTEDPTDPTEATEPATDPTEATEAETKPAETKPSDKTDATKPAETKPNSGSASNKNDPIICRPNSGDQSKFTVSLTEISGKSSLYYNVYSVSGMTIRIESSDAYVVYNGTKYTAKNGVVTFVAENVMDTQPITIEVGNTSSSKKTFTLICEADLGTRENPVVLKKTNDAISATVGGSEESYYYLYTAEKSGTLVITLESNSNSKAKDLVKIDVQNMQSSVCENNNEDGDNKCDVYTVEISVQKGEKVQIWFSVFKNERTYPETDIVWSLKYK